MNNDELYTQLRNTMAHLHIAIRESAASNAAMAETVTQWGVRPSWYSKEYDQVVKNCSDLTIDLVDTYLELQDAYLSTAFRK